MSELVSASASSSRLEIDVPPGWADRTVVTLTGPDDEGFAPNIVVTREPLCDHLGLAGFADGWVARLREEVPVSEVRRGEQIVVAGQRAQLRRLSWAAAGLRLVQLAALVVVGQTGHAIVLTALADQSEEAEAIFAGVLGSVRLPDGVAA